MFKVEEYVNCGKYGVCKIEEVGPLDFGNKKEKKMYYTLIPIYADTSRNYVPVETDKIIMRPVITEKEANDLIDQMKDIEILWIAEEKKREAVFKEAIYKYNCEEWVKVIKTVYLRKEERTAQGKKVTMNDERYLHLAEEYLYGELAVALDMHKDEVENFVVNRVKQLEALEN